MTDFNQPNPIDFAAHVVSRTGSMEYHGKTHQVSVRLQSHNFLSVQAMAETSGLTRSDILNHLIEAGIYAVRGALGEEALEKLAVAERRAAGEFLEEIQREAKQ